MKQTAGKVNGPHLLNQSAYESVMAKHSAPCACADNCLLFVLLLPLPFPLRPLLQATR